MTSLNTTFYESILQVRPDDIDMFQHVHSAKYIDYVLAARYDQMERCYNNPMDEYIKQGLGWVVSTCMIQYKRPLRLGDKMIVKTRIIDAGKYEVKVDFQIINHATGKLCCEGYFNYTLITLASGRATEIPEWALAKYRI